MTYHFKWNNSKTIFGEKLPADSLVRANYASALSNHVFRKSENRDYVLNINASWGHGKTYFLKRWFQDIKRTHPAVYVNAWRHDFSKDPLLTVVSELKTQLTEQFGSKKQAVKLDVGALLKAGAPLVAKEVTKKVLGVNFKELDEAYTSLAGAATEKFAQVMLDAHEEQVAAVSNFRGQLSKLAEEIGEKAAHKPPIFVFIDELDRCRPTFAIELLEVVKHLFDVREFVFIIATDTEQLEHSIKAVYGSGFDARRYLSRFFTERVRLPVKSLSTFLLENEDFNYLFDYDADAVFRQPKLEVVSLSETLSELFNDYNVPLRTILKLLSKAAFSVSTIEPNRWAFDPLFLVLILVVRESSHEYYESLMNDKKSDYEITDKVITTQNLKKYTTKLVVEDEKLGCFGGQERPDREKGISFFELFNLRLAEINGGVTFKETEETLRVLYNRSSEGKHPNNVHDLCILYCPNDKHLLSKMDYKELIEHSIERQLS